MTPRRFLLVQIALWAAYGIVHYLAALPAIAVSAYARPQDRRRALSAGFDGYCAKPVEAPQLLRAVRAVSLPSAS